jgi:hypothetical protein
MNPTLTDAVTTTAPPPGGSLLDEPTFEECHAEFNRFHAATLAGQIDPDHTHDNQFVAFYDGRVVGYGPDRMTLRDEHAALLGIHPARLVVEFLLVSEVLYAGS